MIVRAVERCFVGGRLRYPGAEFEYDGELRECLEVVKKEPVVPEQEQKPEPRRRKKQEE